MSSQNPGVSTTPSEESIETFTLIHPQHEPTPLEVKVLKDRVGWKVILTEEQRDMIKNHLSTIKILTPQGKEMKLFKSETIPGKESYCYIPSRDALRKGEPKIGMALFDSGSPTVGFYDPRKTADKLAHNDLVDQGKRLKKK